MSRVVRQPLPDPPPGYDQQYFLRLVNALNLFMNQVIAPAEIIGARFIATSTPIVDPTGENPDAQLDTTGLPTGLLYLLRDPDEPVDSPTAYFVSIVKEQDQ